MSGVEKYFKVVVCLLCAYVQQCFVIHKYNNNLGQFCSYSNYLKRRYTQKNPVCIYLLQCHFKPVLPEHKKGMLVTNPTLNPIIFHCMSTSVGRN